MQAPKPRQSTKDKPPSTVKAPARADWEAVERDYRTGQLTLRELQAKHGPPYATIGQRAKREGWTQDLRVAVRKATNAALIEELTTQATRGATQSHTNTVLAAAEANKQVILGHRKRLAVLTADAEWARAKLVALGGTVADVKEAAVVVAALESLSRLTKNVIAGEREAYALDDSAPPPKPPAEDYTPAQAYDTYREWLRG